MKSKTRIQMLNVSKCNINKLHEQITHKQQHSKKIVYNSFQFISSVFHVHQ